MSSLKLFSAARQRAFKNIPKLSKADKQVYFLIDVETRKLLNKIRTDINKVGFLVAKAYFQAKGQFFSPARFSKEDIRAAEKSLGLEQPVDIAQYKPDSIALHKKMILAHFSWTAFSDDALTTLSGFADNLVAVRQNKEDVLFSLVSFCWQNRIEIPSYSTLSELITERFRGFDERLYDCLERHATAEKKRILHEFYDQYGEQYKAQELKRIDQAHTQRALKNNAHLLALYQFHFTPLVSLYEKLHLTDEAIKHYAETVMISDVRAIKRLGKTPKSYLLHCAFIRDQYYSRQDYAADAIIKVIVGHMNSARGSERKRREAGLKKLTEDNKRVISGTKELKQVLNKILSITNDTKISDPQKTEQVRQLVLAFFASEDPDFDDRLNRVDESLTHQVKQIDFYSALFDKAIIMQRELGELVNQIHFDNDSQNNKLIAALQFYKLNPKHVDENSPIAFLSKSEQEQLLNEDNYTTLNKFRVLLLVSLCKALKERSVTIEHSYKYRHPAHYLISDDEWKNNKQRLLKAVSMEKFLDGQAVLQKVGKSVSEAFLATNRRIEAQENAFFSLNNNGEWFVGNLDADFSMTKVIPGLLSSSKGISLQEIMFESDKHANFFECFTNRAPTGGKSEISKRLLFATILSLGTNLGHAGLARATKLFSEKALLDTEKTWLTIKNIEKANDRLVETIQALSLPVIFNDNKGVLHSSSDGKKVVVNVNSLLANFSYKYYGKEQGVSVNSFLDEKQSLFCVNVLTSSDREAPYVLEGLVSSKHALTNDEIDRHLHSTDTHGYTEAIFAALHFLDVSFAPRIKNVGRQALYVFDSASKTANQHASLAPSKQINKKLILEHWDDLLRLMVSMKLRRCSPSQMLKTLSASERASSLYRAFKEFGRLLKTNFILMYVDDEDLRQSIHKQLNRVKLGQKLGRKVMFGRNGKFQVGLQEDIQRVASCNTLLRNMIILWNYLFLSDHCLKIQDKAERKQLIDTIASGSVIAWAHVNFLGTYDFDENSESAFSSTFQQMKSMKL